MGCAITLQNPGLIDVRGSNSSSSGQTKMLRLISIESKTFNPSRVSINHIMESTSIFLRVQQLFVFVVGNGVGLNLRDPLIEQNEFRHFLEEQFNSIILDEACALFPGHSRYGIKIILWRNERNQDTRAQCYNRGSIRFFAVTKWVYLDPDSRLSFGDIPFSSLEKFNEACSHTKTCMSPLAVLDRNLSFLKEQALHAGMDIELPPDYSDKLITQC